MKRIKPTRIEDKSYLSYLLEQYLQTLSKSPFCTDLASLAKTCHIPQSIFRRLINMRQDPKDAEALQAEDFHIVFANLLFRYPTVKFWQLDDGSLFIEI